MNSTSNVMSQPLGSNPSAVLSPTRPFYWSLRRELWEYRSVYLAPLAIAGVSLFGFLFVLARLPQIMRSAMALDAAHQHEALIQPYEIVAALIMGAAFIISIFYSLDALYGERRDRSILFWKSLPLSDLTTVLAKATVSLLVLPAVAFAVTVVTEVVMLVLSSMVLLASGLSVGALWNNLEPFQVMTMLLYHLVTVHMFWYAPLYAWLLLISAWSRRVPYLWAALPPFAIVIFEKIAFHTSYFAAFLRDRVSGDRTAVKMGEDFPIPAHMQLTIVSFLASPGLWLGLIAAAAFLFAAARLRRYRGPV